MPAHAQRAGLNYHDLAFVFIYYEVTSVHVILLLQTHKHREGLKTNDKLGLLSENPLTPPPLQTWALLYGLGKTLSNLNP